MRRATPLVLAVACATAAGCGDERYEGNADNQYAHAVEISFAGKVYDNSELDVSYVVPAKSHAFLFQGPLYYRGHLRVFDVADCRLLGEGEFDGALLIVRVKPEGNVELTNRESGLAPGAPATYEAEPTCS